MWPSRCGIEDCRLLSDMLEQYWADVPGNGLRHAIKSFHKHFSLHTYQGRTAVRIPVFKGVAHYRTEAAFPPLGDTHSLIG